MYTQHILWQGQYT